MRMTKAYTEVGCLPDSRSADRGLPANTRKPAEGSSFACQQPQSDLSLRRRVWVHIQVEHCLKTSGYLMTPTRTASEWPDGEIA